MCCRVYQGRITKRPKEKNLFLGEAGSKKKEREKKRQKLPFTLGSGRERSDQKGEEGDKRSGVMVGKTQQNNRNRTDTSRRIARGEFEGKAETIRAPKIRDPETILAPPEGRSSL